jgi:queuine tRNA-ribosyltransferase
MFKITHTDNKARVGKLTIGNKSIETPFFMPAATKATGKVITTDDYKEAGVKTLIMNALLTSLKPGIETVKKAGGLHQFSNFDGIIFTDCGGFQISRDIFEKKSKKGLHFRSPYDNQKIILTPKKIMEIELSLNSDVAMMLDDMSGYGVTKEEARIAMENTHRWGKESLEWHQKLKNDNKQFNDSNQLLFGIIQGNFFPDLRKESAKFINSLNFDGIAIGGVAIGEPKEKMHEAIDASLPYISKDEPRYVMGVGSPKEILDLIEKGIDCFDSVYPTQVARHGDLFIKEGKLSIDKLKYQEDFTSINKNCKCHTCQNYTKAYLHHLRKIKEPVFNRLASIHNTFFIQELLKDTREAIKKGKFNEFKKNYLQ